MPFMLHVGAAPLQHRGALDEQRPAADRRLAGRRRGTCAPRTSTVLHHAAERFISTLVLDGVLERHPTLRGGVIELGAGWVPDMLRRLDQAAEDLGRSRAAPGGMQRRRPSRSAASCASRPIPSRTSARSCARASPELYLFSSDYPHAEGGRDPIGRFERALEGADEAVMRRFYADNFADLYPQAVDGLVPFARLRAQGILLRMCSRYTSSRGLWLELLLLESPPVEHNAEGDQEMRAGPAKPPGLQGVSGGNSGGSSGHRARKSWPGGSLRERETRASVHRLKHRTATWHLRLDAARRSAAGAAARTR